MLVGAEVLHELRLAAGRTELRHLERAAAEHADAEDLMLCDGGALTVFAPSDARMRGGSIETEQQALTVSPQG